MSFRRSARRRPRAALAAVVLAWAAAAAVAAPRGAAAWPSREGGQGLFDVQSAEVPVAGSIAVSVSGTGYRVGADRAPFDAYDRDVLDGGLTVAYGLGGRAELRFRTNHTAWHFGSRDVISYRDGLVGGKVALPFGPRWLATGLDASVTIPWGARDRGFSSDTWDPAVTALFTIPLPESNSITSAALHLNVGYRAFGDSRGRGFEGFPWYYLEPVHPGGGTDRLDLRGALELGSRRLTLFVELLLDRILDEDVAWRESPLFLTPGLRWNLGDSWSVALASKVTLATDDDSTVRFRPPEDLYPEWQLGFQLAWSKWGPDVDRDGDGVPDWKDRCPRVPEDRDGWEDDDGCPDPDDDQDGIIDAFDGAPRQAEDFDDYLDSDGIPDPDNDGDGILDVDDACPDEAEDFDGVADGDGCPEDDADGDGVPDADDACPEEAETPDGIEDEDGCPDGVGLVEPYRLEGVTWEGAAVAPATSSYLDLNGLAETLLGDPRLAVELRVQGGAADLAERRAQYLKGYLVVAGVAPERVRATGDAAAGGPDRPVVEVVPQAPAPAP